MDNITVKHSKVTLLLQPVDSMSLEELLMMPSHSTLAM